MAYRGSFGCDQVSTTSSAHRFRGRLSSKRAAHNPR
jgi:hypothetical protein